jgi:hypothetical protein
LFNQDRLRQLHQAYHPEIEIFCSHDPVEYERLTGQSMRRPLPAAAL